MNIMDGLHIETKIRILYDTWRLLFDRQNSAVLQGFHTVIGYMIGSNP